MEKLFLEQAVLIIKSTPNDQELGNKIRKLFNDFNK
jgi:hypothetical protein